ncbi:MAG: NAD-dependent epimerase/dehydratase family protein [Ornithinimicrobium sp.]
MRTVVVYGARGFLGGAICAALEQRGVSVVASAAPRLRQDADHGSEPDLGKLAAPQVEALKDVRPDVVINAGGLRDVSHGQNTSVYGANVVLPAVLGYAARSRGASYIHLSSGSVQGDHRVLDSSRTWDPQSAFAESKASGERLLLATSPVGAPTTIYRPPTVHALQRRSTRALSRYAASGFATTSARERGSPQALLPNVADAVAFLATSRSAPLIVHQPSEGLTNHSLLRMLGGRDPHLIADPLARFAARSASASGRLGLVHQPQAIRLRLLMLGQEQARSWLTDAGWTPPISTDGWQQLSSRRSEVDA